MQVDDPEDLSALLFHPKQHGPLRLAAPYLGPIDVVKDRRVVVEGRGLVAIRDVQVGECLFVIEPAVAADVQVVWNQWRDQQDKSLREITEEVLLEAMMEAIESDKRPMTARSFLELQGTTHTQTDDEDILVAKLLGLPFNPKPLTEEERSISRTQLLQIIRRNAFGPDALITYESIENRWQQQETVEEPHYRPNRLLGLYPLASMINHGCVANTVRVFAGEVMIVHTISKILAGQEVQWSYISPTIPYPQRSQLLNQYSFTCHCGKSVTVLLWRRAYAGHSNSTNLLL